ncbi:MAG: DeoR family transcriptional regulator [Oscillospiraceae bacterium]|nr:DeoR family transcriptional regulator [Oscillospiraceae bacterium]
MNAIERREEIMRILIVRRHETMQVLAAEFGVTDRTIRNDITILTAKYPLKTSRGIGGGVSIPDSFHPHKNILSVEQVNVLKELIPKANEHQQTVVLNYDQQ